MLRKSIPIFRIGLIVFAFGLGLYFFNQKYAKFILGLGMIFIASAMVLYILFMFRRYGEKKNIH